MSELEDRLGAILGNPQLMQQIMGMAQTLDRQAGTSAPQEPAAQPAPQMPDMDPAMIGRIMELTGKAGIDANQKNLLQALSPYLTQHRLQKLEKAMRAAKLAGAASGLLQNGTIPFLSGR